MIGFMGERGKEDEMMLGDDTDKVNEDVERLTEAAWGSYEAAVENTAAVHETNTRIVRSLFQTNIDLLRAQAEIQAEANLHSLQSLAEQARKHREALLGLSRESLNAYDGFLGSLSSYYEEVSEESERPGR